MSTHCRDMTGKKLERKVQNKSEICVSRVIQRRGLFLKRSPNFLDTHVCGSNSVCLVISFFLFFLFLKKIHHIGFISSRFSCTACHSPLSSVWSLSSRAPWKPCASWQKCTSAHTRPYSLQKGQKHLDLSFPAAPRWHGQKHKTGSVWQKPLLFIDWETRMSEWL